MGQRRGAEWPPPESPEPLPDDTRVEHFWTTWRRPDGSTELVGPGYPPSEGSVPTNTGPTGHPIPAAPPAPPPPPPPQF